MVPGTMITGTLRALMAAVAFELATAQRTLGRATTDAQSVRSKLVMHVLELVEGCLIEPLSRRQPEIPLKSGDIVL